MAKIEYLLVADTVIIEEKTLKASAVGIFQSITIPGGAASAVLPVFCVFARIKNLPNIIISSKITIFKPSGGILQTVETGGGKINGAVQLRGFFQTQVFSEIGLYKIVITIDGEDLIAHDEHSIEVKR